MKVIQLLTLSILMFTLIITGCTEEDESHQTSTLAPTSTPTLTPTSTIISNPIETPVIPAPTPIIIEKKVTVYDDFWEHEDSHIQIKIDENFYPEYMIVHYKIKEPDAGLMLKISTEESYQLAKKGYAFTSGGLEYNLFGEGEFVDYWGREESGEFRIYPFVLPNGMVSEVDFKIEIISQIDNE